MRRLSHLALTLAAILLWLIAIPLCWIEVIARSCWACCKATAAATDMIFSYIRSLWRN